MIGLTDGRKTILLITVNHNKSVQTLTVVKPLASCSGMSLARPCSWAGQRPVWRYWVAPCCAAPAPKTTCEDSNITANHSLPQPGSTCKPHPLPAATQTESRGHTWHRHLLLRLCLLKTKPKRLSCMQSCRTLLTDTGTYTCHIFIRVTGCILWLEQALHLNLWTHTLHISCQSSTLLI